MKAWTNACRIPRQLLSNTPNIVKVENPRFASSVDLFLKIQIKGTSCSQISCCRDRSNVHVPYNKRAVCRQHSHVPQEDDFQFPRRVCLNRWRIIVAPNTILVELHNDLPSVHTWLIFNLPRYSHITPVLSSLHWLPVKFRVNFKILLFTFKVIYGLTPRYLCDLITIKEQSRYSLRSDERLLLEHTS